MAAQAGAWRDRIQQNGLVAQLDRAAPTCGVESVVGSSPVKAKPRKGKEKRAPPPKTAIHCGAAPKAKELAVERHYAGSRPLPAKYGPVYRNW